MSEEASIASDNSPVLGSELGDASTANSKPLSPSSQLSFSHEASDFLAGRSTDEFDDPSPFAVHDIFSQERRLAVPPPIDQRHLRPSHLYKPESILSGTQSLASSRTSMTAKVIEKLVTDELLPFKQRTVPKHFRNSVDLGAIYSWTKGDGPGGDRISSSSVSSLNSASNGLDAAATAVHISSLASAQNMKMKLFLESLKIDQGREAALVSASLPQSARPRIESNIVNGRQEHDDVLTFRFFDEMEKDIQGIIKKTRAVFKDSAPILPPLSKDASANRRGIKHRVLRSRKEIEADFRYAELQVGEYLDIPVSRYVDLRMNALMSDDHAVEALEQRIEAYDEKKKAERETYFNDHPSLDSSRRPKKIDYIEKNLHAADNYHNYLTEAARSKTTLRKERYHNFLMKRRRQQKISIEKQLLLLDTPESKKLVLLYQIQRDWLTFSKIVKYSRVFSNILTVFFIRS